MAGLLDGRVAVVTGGAQGIGAAIGRLFREHGASVVVADVESGGAESAARELAGVQSPGSAAGIACAVTDPDEVEAVAARAVDAFGGLDVWVNNAGIARDASLRRMTVDQFDAVIAVHLRGAWLGVRAASAVMRERGGGSIVNMSSLSGKSGNAGQTNYSAAKAGIVGLTKSAAKELASRNVRVNAVQPGLIRTPMTAAMTPATTMPW